MKTLNLIGAAFSGTLALVLIFLCLQKGFDTLDVILIGANTFSFILNFGIGISSGNKEVIGSFSFGDASHLLIIPMLIAFIIIGLFVMPQMTEKITQAVNTQGVNLQFIDINMASSMFLLIPIGVISAAAIGAVSMYWSCRHPKIQNEEETKSPVGVV
jgi:uncharacterized protein with PQ loop repeat